MFENNKIRIFYHFLQVAAASQNEALEWADKIRETSKSASFREEKNRKKERALRIARELSNLVIYCRSVVFNMERYCISKVFF